MQIGHESSHESAHASADSSTHDIVHKIGNGPNTVSESTVSDTELSEFFGPHRVPGITQ